MKNKDKWDEALNKMSLIYIIGAFVVLVDFAHAQVRAEDTTKTQKPAQESIVKEFPILNTEMRTETRARWVKVRNSHRYFQTAVIRIDAAAFHGDRVTMKFLDLPVRVIQKTEFKKTPSGSHIWKSIPPDGSPNSSIFVIRNNNVTGTIIFNHRVFSIFPIGDGLHVLAETAQNGYPICTVSSKNMSRRPIEVKHE